MKKKNLAKKYFIIVSATFICGLLFAYGTRLVHFYLKENKSSEGEETREKANYFSEVLENTINVTDTNGGLYLDKESYIYKYATEDNYLWYSGQLWRLLRVNEDKTITMITDDSISLLQLKYEENDYLEEFLNEFYEKLDKTYLVSFNVCNDKIVEGKTVKCEETKEANISLLDVYSYNKAGNSKSFLNNKTAFWLNNKNDEENYIYATAEGSISIGSDIAHNIRPVVTLKDKIKLVSGEGTKENPYIITEKESTKITDSVVGEYIKYNDSIWRVIEINETSIKAIKTTCIEDENGECIVSKFGSSIKYLNSTLYKYLNNTYYKNLENNDFIIKGNFYNGVYTNYDYKELRSSTVEAYVGLPKIAEYYSQNNLNSYLITPNTIDTVYTINDDGYYYLVAPSNELNIYPVVNFDIELNIVAGNGTIGSPYELSR